MTLSRNFLFFLIFTVSLMAQGTDPAYLKRKGAQIRLERLPNSYEKLKALHQKKKPTEAGDWLAEHREKGQTLQEYLRRRRIRPGVQKKFIYIQLIGSFSKEQEEILETTKEYMSLCFGVEVKELAVYPLKKLPKPAQRIHSSWGNRQLYTGYLMDKVLKKRKPKDALCVIGFTAIDLYPRPSWNFVFGVARPGAGLGMWSIYRNGDPAESKEAYQLCLRRTISTAIHETAHIFAVKHCIAYQCVMNGSNSREESDSRDMFFCPSCLHKICRNMKLKAKDRFESLKELCLESSLTKEAKFFKKSLKTMTR